MEPLQRPVVDRCLHGGVRWELFARAILVVRDKLARRAMRAGRMPPKARQHLVSRVSRAPRWLSLFSSLSRSFLGLLNTGSSSFALRRARAARSASARASSEGRAS